MVKFTKNIKIKPFIDKYNWKSINAPSGKDFWKKPEKNNSTIAPNALYIDNRNFCTDIENIYPAYVSKHNSESEKKIILMIPNHVGWHCIAVTKLSALLRGVTSKRNGHFYFLNCFHSCRTKK